jgi:hypothetical protein
LLLFLLPPLLLLLHVGWQAVQGFTETTIQY